MDDFKRLWKAAKRYAAAKGHPEEAEDFAQQVCIWKWKRGAINLEWAWIDYFREIYGKFDFSDKDHKIRRDKNKRAQLRNMRSLDARALDMPEGVLKHETIRDTKARTPEQMLINAQREQAKRKIFEKYFGGFAGQEAQVLELYLQGDITQAEIGRRLGMLESRVSQLMKSIVHKIKNGLPRVKPRPPNPKLIEAIQMRQAGYLLRDIAKKINVRPGVVGAWLCRHKVKKPPHVMKAKVFDLRLQGNSVRKISQMTGVPIGTIDNWIQASRKEPKKNDPRGKT